MEDVHHSMLGTHSILKEVFKAQNSFSSDSETITLTY